MNKKKLLFFIALIFTLNISAQVYVPNSFTPNNDGINDYIAFYTQDTLDEFEFTLFNRTGEIVWFTQDYEAKWDGGDDYYALDGIYTYIMKYRNRKTRLYKIQRGNITLIR
jgi:gliding motility-associated-like protein